jgi:hypothetical protein
MTVVSAATVGATAAINQCSSSLFRSANRGDTGPPLSKHREWLLFLFRMVRLGSDHSGPSEARVEGPLRPASCQSISGAAKGHFEIRLNQRLCTSANGKLAAVPLAWRCNCEALLRQQRSKIQGPQSPHCISSSSPQRTALFPEPATRDQRSEGGATDTELQRPRVDC